MTDPIANCDEDSLGLGWVARRHWGAVRLTGALVWLLFILFPLVNAVSTRAPALRHVLVILAAAVFVSAYVALVLMRMRHRGLPMLEPSPVPSLLFGVLLSVATALTTADQTGWAFLYTYCAACAALIAPPRLGVVSVAACTALAGVVPALAGATRSSVVSFVATAGGIGMLMLLMRDLRLRNEQLSQARAELAQRAVTQERERFARDLHDLLGHSLSLIALKAQLAGRLLTARPQEAAGELLQIEEVARGALSEVREAVSGYRQPTLEGELAGARMALSAAGIEADVSRPAVTLPPPVEAMLAWAVREGATNVIRHSGARRCTVRVTAGLDAVGVEVLDDGAAAAPASAGLNGHGGNGLKGLRERAKRLHGRLEAGACADGGFRLAVSVPRQAR